MPSTSAAWRQIGNGKGREQLTEQKRKQGNWLSSKLRMLRGLIPTYLQEHGKACFWVHMNRACLALLSGLHAELFCKSILSAMFCQELGKQVCGLCGFQGREGGSRAEKG